MGAAENLCHIHVPVCQTRLVIYKKKNQIGLLCGYENLTTDSILKDIIRLDDPSTGIYNGKLMTIPGTFAILTVTGRSGGIRYDSPTGLCQSVKQC